MCKLKSAIALKDRIFMPDYDSHSDMLKELGIEDDFIGASKKFVRVELSPADGDPFSDIDTWALKVDQDIRPDWFSEEEYKPKIVEAVKAWAKNHIFVGIDGLKLNTGTNYYIKDCKNVEIGGSAQVENIGGSAQVENICGSAQVENIGGSAQVKYIGGSAQVENIGGSAQVEYICGSAQVKYICGSAQVENIGGSAQVKYIGGSAQVEYICGSAQVEYICGSAQVKKASGVSVICSSQYTKWKNAGSLILCENATFKDNVGKVIYQSGDYKLIHVESGKSIGEANAE
ncbi:MAG: hypothetical protein IJW55_07425 [Clostridia bacterium]|nr:hypothetical protein [Clostridia bacterium]